MSLSAPGPVRRQRHADERTPNTRQTLLREVTFEGLTGSVRFDADSSREGPMALMNWVSPGRKRVVLLQASGSVARARVRPQADTALAVLVPFVYAGNASNFTNKVLYRLQWSMDAGAPGTFTSRNDGAAVLPIPKVHVRQADGRDINFQKAVRVVFSGASVQVGPTPAGREGPLAAPGPSSCCHAMGYLGAHCGEVVPLRGQYAGGAGAGAGKY